MDNYREKAARFRARQSTTPNTVYKSYLKRSTKIVDKYDIGAKVENNGNITLLNDQNITKECIKTFYPNNVSFAEQGAVSQNGIISRKKYMALRQNISIPRNDTNIHNYVSNDSIIEFESCGINEDLYEENEMS